MDTIKIEIDITITDEDIWDMPFGSGTSYWGQLFIRNSGGKLGYDFYELNEYGEAGKYPHHVSNDDIRNAFAALVVNRDNNGKPYNVADYIMEYFRKAVFNGENGRLDLGDIDSEAADVLMQVAIWDDVIYG